MCPCFRVLTGLLLLGSGALHGQSQLTINWGTALGNQKLITSDGTALDPNDYTIQIGTFEEGFIPTEDNVDLWMDYWIAFDDASVRETGPDRKARYSGSAHLLEDQSSDSPDSTLGGTFESGTQAYVLVMEETESGEFEWGIEVALYTNVSGDGVVSTDPWVFPDVNGDPQLPLNWFISGADTAVVGAVAGGTEDEFGNNTGIGGGYYTDTSTDFVLRTHRVLPEPGLGMLLAAFAASVAFRRSRQPSLTNGSGSHAGNPVESLPENP